MSAQKLYMAVWITDGDGQEVIDTNTRGWVHAGPSHLEPAGWREHALEMWGTEPREGEHWPNGHKPFFWPKTDVPYKSRSSAQYRVDIINRWGGRAVVVECTPQWETVSAANARRERARIQKRIDRKRAELAALESLVPQPSGNSRSLRDMVRGIESIQAGV